MVFGALTAVMVIITQLFLYEVAATGHEGIKTEKKNAKSGEQSSEDQVLISLPSDSVLSSFHSGIHHEAVLLFEIVYGKEETVSWAPEVPVSLGKYFLTLFHIIISPNAP